MMIMMKTTIIVMLMKNLIHPIEASPNQLAKDAYDDNDDNENDKIKLQILQTGFHGMR